MKEKKKNRKLLLQIGLVILPLFLLMIAAVAYSMYKNTVNSYLEAQNERISDTLNAAFKKAMLSDDTFFYDYVLAHPSLALYDYSSSEGETSLEKFSKEFGIELTDEEQEQIFNNILGDNLSWNTEWIKEQSESVQLYCVYTYYSLNLSINSSEAENYDSMFLIDIREPNEGFVYFEVNNSEGNRILGSKLDLNLSDHPVLEKLLAEPSDKNVFEKTRNLTRDESQYIGYKPLICDGKVFAVLGISYNWSEMHKIMMVSLRNAASVGLGGVLVLMTALFLMLYRMAIKPVGLLQDSVCDYIEEKDSEKVINALKTVKAKNEIGVLSDNIAVLAREIDSYTAENIRLAGERERVAAELDMAKNIQASQLPNIFPPFPEREDFEIYASMTPAKEVGGDFYDFFFIDDDHLALVIADVSGKGIPAALFMMVSKMLINNFASMGMSHGEVLTKTNEKLCENNEEKMFVTVWLGIIELSTGRLTASNGGHEYPMIKQPGGSFELFKDKHSLVVGGMEGMKYKQYELTLPKGSTLFVYTDGVPEATDSNEKMFGTDRLIEALNLEPDAPPQRILENVRGAVNGFVGGAPQFDDLTMLCLHLR